MLEAAKTIILPIVLGLTVTGTAIVLAMTGLVVLASDGTDNDQASRLGLQAARDVALISIATVGPPFAYQGDTVTIRVQAKNNGNHDETFELSLWDDTDKVAISAKETTLGAGASSSIDFLWDTSGASGGPPPPGPPTPRTVHVISATISLAQDTDASNDSVSLLPGIWIIAAPTVKGITFPDIEMQPQAKFNIKSSLTQPEVKTSREALSSLFLSYVQGSALLGLSSPAFATGPVALARVYNTMVAGRLGQSLARPIISTIPETTASITYDEVQAGVKQLLAAPVINTIAGPTVHIIIEELGPRRGEEIAAPTIATAKALLDTIFATPLDAVSQAPLESPAVVAGPGLTDIIQSTFQQARDDKDLKLPKVDTLADPLQSPFMAQLSAKSSGGLARSPVDTVVSPQTQVFPGGVQSNSSLRTSRPAVEAKPEPLSNLYTSMEIDARSANRAMANPFEFVLVRGAVELQGRNSSLGSYVEAGEEVFYVGRDGGFEFMARTEFSSVKVDAPGYLPMSMNTGNLLKGQTVVLPKVTLFFGEVNNDDIIDIYDITLAASNYGRTNSSLETD